MTLSLVGAAACATGGPPAPDPAEIDYDPSTGVEIEAMTAGPRGLLLRDLEEGAGREARRGDLVRIHFIGRFPDGELFDTSLAAGEPIEFRLGDGEVIRAWDEGIVGMREGGRRVLVAPPALAYGARGVPGVIPRNRILVFELQLIEAR